VKTLSTFSRRCASEHRSTPHALGCELDGMGRPKAAVLGQLAGLRSSGTLWPWAIVRPGGIVNSFNFLWIYSNSIRFELESPQICSNSVFE
jgi:hypothetical protein